MPACRVLPLIPRHYFWLVWALSMGLVWLLIYWLRRDLRTVLWRASLGTLPFACNEPLFVGTYWMPPSLFNLAAHTGFDVESFIFCFAIGGSRRGAVRRRDGPMHFAYSQSPRDA